MATYKIKTRRYIRKYTAAEKLPVSAALIDAQRVVDELCNVPWEQAAATTSVITSHDESELDANVSNRDRFDAALFCADHANGAHRAYANAACYKIPFPTGTAGKKITSLKVRVTSDAYNAAGARIALVTNSTGVIPTSCAECRGEGAGGIHAAGVAPQTIQTVGGQRYGYPTIADCIFNVSPGEGEYALPTGGLTLGSYLYVFVLMENYNSVRGNWLEGSSCIVNQIEIVTDSAITGWTDGSLIDLTNDSRQEFVICSGSNVKSNLKTGTGVMGCAVLPNGDAIKDLERTITYSSKELIAFTGGSEQSKMTFPGDAHFKSYRVCWSGTTYSYAWMTKGSITNYIFAWSDSLRKIWASIDGSDFIEVAQEQATINHSLGNRLCRIDLVYSSAGTYLSLYFSDGYIARISLESKLNPELDYFNSSTYYYSSNTHIGSYWLDDGVLRPTGVFYSYGEINVEGEVFGMSENFKYGSNYSLLVGSYIVIYGRLNSVGGKTCKNVAIIEYTSTGMNVIIPAFDSFITPNTYNGFRIEAQTTLNQQYGDFYVSGEFTSLSGISAHGVVRIASLSSTSFEQLDLSGNAVDAVYSNDTLYYVGAEYEESVIFTSTSIGSYTNKEYPARELLSRFYLGMCEETERDLFGVTRKGVAFSVGVDKNIQVVGFDTSGNQVSRADFFVMCAASLVVPFSLPVNARLNTINLDWSSWSNGGGAATSGSFVNVWIKRGEYIDEYPSASLKNAELYDASKNVVDGWELLGRIDVSGSATTATLDLPDISGRVSTLMFTGYVNTDWKEINSAWEGHFGVCPEFKVNPWNGSVSGASKLWFPNITLSN